MQAQVSWKEGLSFTGRAESGFEVALGASPEVGGANDGFRPLELMALSLAGCTAMEVISILRKKQQAVTGFEVRVDAEQAEGQPHVFTRAVITYLVRGHAVEESAVLRAIELTATRYCPAQAMLGRAFPIDLAYEISEQQPDGQARLVKTGRFTPAG